MIIEIKSPLRIFRQKADKAISFQTMGGQKFFNLSEYLGGLSSLGLNLTSAVDCKTVNGQALAYANCPVVTGVVNARATAATMAKWAIVDDEDNEVKSEYQWILDRPNPLQTWMQFVNNANVYKDIFGRCVMLPLKSDFAVDKSRAKTIWIIPEWLITTTYTGKQYSQSDVSGIVSHYRIQGIDRDIMPDELIIWEDTGVNTSMQSNQLTTYQSRLYNLSDQVGNIQRAYEARAKIMRKGGPPGAWVNDNPKDAAGMNAKRPDEVDQAQKEFQKHGLGVENPYLYAILTSPWKFVTAGSPTKDLMLFEEVKDDAWMLAFAYNLPEHLMPWGGDKTFNNVTASEKKFYTNAIIPAQNDLGRVIFDWFKVQGQYLKPFFDHLEAFQSDKKAEGEAFNTWVSGCSKALRDTAITRDEYRMILSQMLDTSIFDPNNPNGEFIEIQSPTTIIQNGS